MKKISIIIKIIDTTARVGKTNGIKPKHQRDTI